jgi:hypothetical protein
MNGLTRSRRRNSGSYWRPSPSRLISALNLFYGTTLRIYDPGLDAWHILWSDPLKQFYTRQIGRADGRDIVQEGNAGIGETMRWSFTEITLDSFRWTGERSLDGGASWQLQGDFRARRAATAFSQQRTAS